MFLRYMSVFFLSMVPLLELRGAIPIAVGLGIEPVHAVIVCAIGNLVPVPFIYFFARKFLVWGLDKKYIGGICHFFHDKGQRAGEKLSGKAGKWGLMLALTLFVGVPVPGTGGLDGDAGCQLPQHGSQGNSAVRWRGCGAGCHHYDYRQSGWRTSIWTIRSVTNERLSVLQNHRRGNSLHQGL